MYDYLPALPPAPRRKAIVLGAMLVLIALVALTGPRSSTPPAPDAIETRANLTITHRLGATIISHSPMVDGVTACRICAEQEVDQTNVPAFASE